MPNERVLEISDIETAEFKARPNRFLVELGDGRLAHLHDPGRLKELLTPGVELIVKSVNSTTRKTNLDVLAVRYSNYWVFLNSGYHSKIAEAIIPKIFGPIKSKEVKFGDSRIDFLLDDGRPLEVKGCTLMKNRIALFPDAPTARGARHVLELAKHKGALLFLVFHPFAKELRPNCEMDPKFCEAMRMAKRRGVEMKAAKIWTKLTKAALVLDFIGEVPVVT